MFGPWDRSSSASDPRAPERASMVELHSPEGEGDLLILRSLFDAAGLHYFVKGDHFGSLTVGPRIDHYNRKAIYVHPDDAEEARELLSEFRVKTERPAEETAVELRGRDVLRMLIEVLLFGWFMPGRRSRPASRPRLRVIRGGRRDDRDDP